MIPRAPWQSKEALLRYRHNRIEPKMPRLAALLQEARDRKGVNQKEIAESLSAISGHTISPSRVAQLETGKVTNPDSDCMHHLEQVYGVAYRKLVSAVMADKYGVPYESLSFFSEHAMSPTEFGAWGEKLPDGAALWVGVSSPILVKEGLLASLSTICQRQGSLLFIADESEFWRSHRTLRNTLEVLVAERKHRGAEPLAINVLSLAPAQVPLLIPTGFIIVNPMETYRGDGSGVNGFILIERGKSEPLLVDWDRTPMQRNIGVLHHLAKQGARPFAELD